MSRALVEPENLIAAVIDAAEDIRDPLDGLVERTAAGIVTSPLGLPSVTFSRNH